MTFSLNKWYVDVVTNDGCVGIAYRAEIRHGPLGVDLTGVLVHRGAAQDTAPWRFSMRRTAPPAAQGNVVRWTAPRLRLTVECDAHESSFEQRLLQTRDGAIDWQCVQPRACVRFRAGDASLEGLGYVEQLRVTGIAPWSIPANEIRWGRFLTDSTSIVWVDWRGDSPRRFVFQDGSAVMCVELSDDCILLADGTRLTLRDPRIVAADTLGHQLLPLKPLRTLVRPLARTQQTRWCSVGELRRPGATTVHTGWTIHELLRRG
jgi:hypothetical protein